MADAVAADEALLGSLTEVAWRDHLLTSRADSIDLQRSGWRALPLALRRRLLRKAVAEIGTDLSDLGFRPLEAARRIAETGKTGERAMLPGGIVMLVEYDRLRLTREPYAVAADLPQLPAAEPIRLLVPGAVRLADGWLLTAEIVDADLAVIEANSDPWMAHLAIDPWVELVVRSRRPGEGIRPLGLGGNTKIKEVMIDRKVPAQARGRWPLVATAEHALWIAGVVLDERVRVKPGSNHVVRLRCVHASENEAG
jgi:tRNA(Ile)-lysidine synthase